jgi:hypothetical protein
MIGARPGAAGDSPVAANALVWVLISQEILVQR